MASKSLGTLTIDLVAKTAGFVQGMDKAERSSAKWKKQVQRDLKQVSSALKTGLAVAATAAAAGLTLIVNRSRETIDALAKTSDKLGVTTNALAELRFAAEQTGVSQQQLDVGLQRFTRRLADAAAGAGPAVKAFEQLGLSAEELVKLSPDEAFKIVADSMQNLESQTQRVAVAFKLFDSEGVGLVNTLAGGSAGLEEFAEQARAAGISLDRIDAAKVEQANDALNLATQIAGGLGAQLTIAVAPAITAVATGFFNMAKDAGGANKLVVDSIQAVIDALAFMADAADGVKRVFVVVADGIVSGMAAVARDTAIVIRRLTMMADILPGIDFTEELQSLTTFIQTQDGVITEAGENIRKTLEAPLAGNAIRDGFKRAQEAANEAAQAAAGAQATVTGSPTVPSVPGVDVTSGGADDPTSIRSASSAVDYTRYAAIEDAAKEHSENLVAIENEKNALLAASGQELFATLSGATREFAGEQSAAYKVLFAIEKGAAIARSIIAIQTGIAQAAANPFPANLAAMASVASATAGIISTITSTSLQGQAHDGLMSVPNTGTYLLEKGERVTTADTSKKMDAMIEDARQGGGGQNLRIVNMYDDGHIDNYLGSSAGEKVIMNAVRRNARTIRSLAV